MTLFTVTTKNDKTTISVRIGNVTEGKKDFEPLFADILDFTNQAEREKLVSDLYELIEIIEGLKNQTSLLEAKAAMAKMVGEIVTYPTNHRGVTDVPR